MNNDPHLITTYHDDGKVTTKRKVVKPHYKSLWKESEKRRDSMNKTAALGWVIAVVELLLLIGKEIVN